MGPVNGTGQSSEGWVEFLVRCRGRGRKEGREREKRDKRFEVGKE